MRRLSAASRPARPAVAVDATLPPLAPAGFTLRLLTTADGQKFGKSAGNALYLDRALTSCHGLYQYLVNTADADAGRLLYALTLMAGREVEEVVREHDGARGARLAQRRLADEVVRSLHGDAGVAAARRCAAVLFGAREGAVAASASAGGAAALVGDDLLEMARARDVASVEVAAAVVAETLGAVAGGGAIANADSDGDAHAKARQRAADRVIGDWFVLTGLTPSRSEFVRLLRNGGASLNGVPLSSGAGGGVSLVGGGRVEALPAGESGVRALLVSAGKKRRAVVIVVAG